MTFALQASKEDRVSYPSPPPRSSADGERKVWLRLCCSLTHFHRRRPPRPRPRTALARRCLRAPRRLLLFRLRPALLNPLSGSLRSMCVAACIGCVLTCVSGATSASVSSSRVPRAVSQPQAPCARRCARRCSSKAGAFANLLPLIACFCCVQARIPRKTDIAVSQVCASADVDAARAAAPVPAPAAFDLASSLSALQSHLPTDGFSSLLVDAA